MKSIVLHDSKGGSKMESFLFLILLLQLFIAIIILKNIAHPIIILKAYCTLSVLGLIRFAPIWGISISPETVLVFSTGLIFVDLGYFLFSSTVKKKLETNTLDNKSDYGLKKNFSIKWAVFLTLYIMGCIIYLIYLRQDILMFGSGFGNLSHSILLAKSATRTGDIESLGAFQYLITSCTVIGITYTYILVYEKFKNGFNKRMIIFALPVIATLVLFYFTGRRAFLLNIIIVSAVLVYEFERRKNRKISFKQQRKLIFFIIIGAFIFYNFFITLGELFGKAGENTVAVYLSGGIAAFDAVYEEYILSSQVFGQNIFRLFYKIVNIIPGVSFPTNTINDTVRVGYGLITNVYTVNLHYMADFGYAGVVIGNTLIGVFYGFLYRKARNEKDVGFWNVLLAYFIINLIAYPGSEKFFVSITVNIQYLVFFYILFKSKITLNKTSKIRNNTNKESLLYNHK